MVASRPANHDQALLLLFASHTSIYKLLGLFGFVQSCMATTIFKTQKLSWFLFFTLIPPPSRQRTFWSSCFWTRPGAFTTLCPITLSITSTSGLWVLVAVSEFWRRKRFLLLRLISLRVLRSTDNNDKYVDKNETCSIPFFGLCLESTVEGQI